MEHHASPFDAGLEEARNEWPGVSIPEDVFRAYLAARCDVRTLTPRIVSALYLACACTLGDAAALRALEGRYFPDLERAVARTRLTPEEAEDVLQSLRAKLLVGDEGGPPRIAEYAGRGDLAGWLRVTAVRAALKRLRARRSEGVDDEDQVLRARASGDDPELSYMKELYRRVFRESFRAAFDGLEAQEKTLLRQHFVDGLSIDDLGRLHGIHRATAARWLQRVRDRLLTGTRRELRARAQMNTQECESVLRLVQSRLDVTLGSLLRKRDDSE